MMPLNRAVEQLVEKCIAAGFEGADFPTVWKTILRKSRLVAGTPVQTVEDGKPVLSIRLTTNQAILYGPGGYSLA
jgi:hypothetical protein